MGARNGNSVPQSGNARTGGAFGVGVGGASSHRRSRSLSSPARRSRSRSGGRNSRANMKKKKEKEFAWMDSSDESGAARAPVSPASSTGSKDSASIERPVPIDKVET